MAAATRLLLLRSPPFFRNFRNATQSPSLSNILLHHPFRSLFLSPHPRPKAFSSRRFHFHSHSTAAAAATSTEAFVTPVASFGTVEEAAAAVSPHPWPEWETFIEQLKGKGYFDAIDADAAPTEAGFGSAALPKDFNRVKAGCMSFARERFDILKYFLPLLIS